MHNKELAKIIEPAVAALDLQLWGCEVLRQGKHSELRVYVEGDNGVTLDQCADVSRQVAAILDVEDPISGAYQLQVSSPGLDRTLFEPAQYTAYVGQQIKVRTRVATEGKRNHVGVLLEVSDAGIRLQCRADEPMQLQFNQIEKAQLVPEF